MTDEGATIVLGITIPAPNPLFLAIVAIHVLMGLAAVIAGAAAIFIRKGRGRHSNLGAVYFWCLFGVFATMTTLSALRWTEDYHLFILGVLSFASACLGRHAARRHWRQWTRVHLSGMGASYVLLVTAFYVDNGRSLPLWRELPQIAFWLLPSAIGLPLIVHALFRHPQVKSAATSRAGMARGETGH